MLERIGRKKALYAAMIVIIAIAGLFVGMMLMDRDQPVQAGQQVVVTISASFEDMYGYQFELIFDEAELEWAGGLSSRIDGFEWIFSKDMGGYRLVGATLTGEADGVSGRNKPVCEMTFTALRDGMLSDFSLDLNRVNVVKDDGEYIKDIDGWSYKLSVQDAQPEEEA